MARLTIVAALLGVFYFVSSPVWAQEPPANDSEPQSPAAAEGDQADHPAGEEHDHAGEEDGGEAHGHGHESHFGEAHSNPDPASLRGDLAVWTLVVFLILLAGLYKFAWGPISEGLEKRERGIAENIAGAERMNQEAKNLLSEYEAKLAQSQNEVRAILDEARRDAEYTQQEILAKAKADAGAERERALRDITTAKQQALQEIATQSADLAVSLAGKIVQQKLSAEDHKALIEDAVGKFVTADPSQN